MEFKGFALVMVVLAVAAILSGINVAAQSTSNNTNTTSVAVNLSTELNNSLASGFNFTVGDFQSTSSAACVRAQITRCNNNNPSQFVCLNSSAYSNAYLPQQQNNTNDSKGFACPDYLLAGVVGCESLNNYCVVTHEQYSFKGNISSNTTLNATTIYHTTTSVPTTTVPVNVPVVGTSTINGIINEIIQFFDGLFKSL